MASMNNKFRSPLDKFLSKKIILYIHGANMSSVSFSVIQKTLRRHKTLTPDYSVDVPLETNIKRIARRALKEFGGKKFDVVSHSLGGIIALLLLLLSVAVRQRLIFGICIPLINYTSR